jgi:hypothetical protein
MKTICTLAQRSRILSEAFFFGRRLFSYKCEYATALCGLVPYDRIAMKMLKLYICMRITDPLNKKSYR